MVGDALLDVDLVGTASRLTPDAPVPVVEDVERRERPGRRRAGRGDRRGGHRPRGRAGGAVRHATRAPTGCAPCSPAGSGWSRSRPPAARRSSSACGSATTRWCGSTAAAPVAALGPLPAEAAAAIRVGRGRAGRRLRPGDDGGRRRAGRAGRGRRPGGVGPAPARRRPGARRPGWSRPNGAEAARVAGAAGSWGDGLAAVGARAEALIRHVGRGRRRGDARRPRRAAVLRRGRADGGARGRR